MGGDDKMEKSYNRFEYFLGTKIRKIAIAICVFFLLSGGFAEETKKSSFFGKGETFQLSVLTDSIILGTGVSLAGFDFLCSDILELNRIDIPASFDKDDVSAFDRPFMNKYSKKVDTLATVLQFGAILSPAILMTTEKSEWATIGTMYAETLIWAYGLKAFGKFVVNRARPYMYFENPPEDDIEKYDWANSFPSGHTTFSFAGASFTSYVFSKYFPDSKWKWLVTGTSFSVAATTGILRMVSGNHFLTDVLAGATIGSLCGFAIPFFHTLFPKNQSNDLQVFANPTGFAVSLKL